MFIAGSWFALASARNPTLLDTAVAPVATVRQLMSRIVSPASTAAGVDALEDRT